MSVHPHKTENPLLKECLFTALIMLMDQKDFKDIKISEIAQKAGVSRMTYYRTYDSKEDILLQYFEDRAKEMVHEMEQIPNITSKQFFYLFFSHFKKHAHLMRYMYRADLLKEINIRLIGFVTNLYNRSPHAASDFSKRTYEIHFVAGGLFTMLLHWIQREMPETPEEMAEMTILMLRIPDTPK